MPTLHERIETTLPLAETFAFVGDFANAAAWDPGVADSQRLDGGPIGVGSRYHLSVRMAGRLAPMAYTVTAFQPERRVVLQGSGSGVQAVDAIDFDAVDGRTVIDYTATIRLVGMRRLVEPFLAVRSGASRAMRAMACRLRSIAASPWPCHRRRCRRLPTGRAKPRRQLPDGYRHRRLRHQRPDGRSRVAPRSSRRAVRG